jgi:hypothetical protein
MPDAVHTTRVLPQDLHRVVHHARRSGLSRSPTPPPCAPSSRPISEDELCVSKALALISRSPPDKNPSSARPSLGISRSPLLPCGPCSLIHTLPCPGIGVPAIYAHMATAGGIAYTDVAVPDKVSAVLGTNEDDASGETRTHAPKSSVSVASS